MAIGLPTNPCGAIECKIIPRSGGYFAQSKFSISALVLLGLKGRKT